LAVDVDQLSKERIYRAQAPCARVLEELQQLRDLDGVHEKRQSGAFNIGCGTMIIGALMGFFGLVTADADGDPGLLPFLLGGAVLLILVGIVAFVMRGRYERLNLENRRYQLVSQTVGLLQADISPEEPVSVELDLRPDTDPDKLRNEGRTRTGWKVKYYLDPWLSLQGRLLDGTHFRLEMTERVEVRSRTKTNARGKTKHKSKQFSDALLRVRLRVKPERYQHLGRLGSQAKGAVQILKGTRLKALTLEADRVDMTLLVESPWIAVSEPGPNPGSTSPGPLNGPRVVAMALLSLYQILNLSRALDKKAVHPPTG
jgi:hypothetical protein